MTMLTVENLHTHYGLSHILQGASFTGEAGEVIGLFGRNGVGKTTLLKTIAGWIRPSEGHIALDGNDLSALRPDQIAQLGLGLVPEDRRIFPGLSVEENLKLGMRQSAGRSRAAQKDALDRAYQRFPRLAERRMQMGTTLSGGEQQMLAMARVLVGEPRILLIDEPTEGLAPFLVEEIGRILSELRERGDLLILLVEQNVHWAMDFTTRFHAVERGRIVCTGVPDRAEDRENLLATIAV
jgi:branched-chain amino acid transport system ATP-binding protein